MDHGPSAAVLIASIGFVLPGAALAQPARGVDADFAIEPPADEVRWHAEWDRFRPWQWVATPTLLAGSFALRYVAPQPSSEWGGILFDGAVDDALAVRSDPGRNALVVATDLHLYASLGLLLADAVVTAGFVHGDWDVALQMALIDLQSVALVMALLWSTQLLARRGRPYERLCGDPRYPDLVPECVDAAGERGRSFIAGHTAIVLTAAGLTCTHHGRMPLFGGGFAEGVLCGTLVTAAVLNGLGRVMTENHHATDVLLGLGLGAAAGWLVPMALHYGFSADEASTVALVPAPIVDGGGLAVIVWNR